MIILCLYGSKVAIFFSIIISVFPFFVYISIIFVHLLSFCYNSISLSLCLSTFLSYWLSVHFYHHVCFNILLLLKIALMQLLLVISTFSKKYLKSFQQKPYLFIVTSGVPCAIRYDDLLFLPRGCRILGNKTFFLRFVLFEGVVIKTTDTKTVEFN